MTNKSFIEHEHCNNCRSTSCFVQRYCLPTWIGIINLSRNMTLYKKDEDIFREGDRVFGMYFIHQGKVKVVSAGLNGRRQIVRMATDGHILGHRGHGAETYPVGAVALDDTWVCFLDNETLKDVFLNNPKFTYELMMFYSLELRKTEMRLRFLAHMSLREKIAECLLSLRNIFGMNIEDGSLNVTLSRQDIADLAGTNAEQVTRELTTLENELILKKRGKEILLLNPDALMEIVSEHKIHKYLSA